MSTPNPSELSAFMAAIRQEESSGNYSITNSIGCKGAYQFCPGTDMYARAQAAGWTPAAQDSIAASTMSSYYSGVAGGNWEYVARAWNGGPGAINHPEWSDGGTTVGEYGAKVVASMSAIMGNPALRQSTTAATSVSDSTTVSSSGGMGGIIQLFSDLLNPKWWARVGRGAAGIAVIGIGGYLILSTTPTGEAMRGAAKQAAKKAVETAAEAAAA